MVFLMKTYICPSQVALLMNVFQLMSMSWKNLYMAWNRLLVPGMTGSLVFYPPLGSSSHMLILLCLWRFLVHQELVFLLLYVVDIIITGNSEILISEVKIALQAEFDMKDLGNLNFFSGTWNQIFAKWFVLISAQVCHISCSQGWFGFLQLSHESLSVWPQAIWKWWWTFIYYWCVSLQEFSWLPTISYLY